MLSITGTTYSWIMTQKNPGSSPSQGILIMLNRYLFWYHHQRYETGIYPQFQTHFHHYRRQDVLTTWDIVDGIITFFIVIVFWFPLNSWGTKGTTAVFCDVGPKAIQLRKSLHQKENKDASYTSNAQKYISAVMSEFIKRKCEIHRQLDISVCRTTVVYQRETRLSLLHQRCSMLHSKYPLCIKNSFTI